MTARIDERPPADPSRCRSHEADQHDDHTRPCAPHVLAEDNLASASPDLLRAMAKTFADALMPAEADAVCNAEHGQASDERVHHRNGYRPRERDTRAAPSNSRCPSRRRAVTPDTSRRGRWNDAAAPSRPSSPWSPPPALLGASTRRGRNPRSPSASRSRASRRPARWPSTWTSRCHTRLRPFSTNARCCRTNRSR
jgi:Transposase, Mutator family